MTDIVERLRARDRNFGRRADEQPALNNPDGPEAADLIEKLRADVAVTDENARSLWSKTGMGTPVEIRAILTALNEGIES